MPLRRKKKTVRDQIESTYEDLRALAAEKGPILRDQVVDQVSTKAPIVRDQVVSKLHDGADELRTRLPELHASLYERLPDDVTDRLPEGAKPKKKKSKLKKVAIVGLIAAAGGFAYSKLKGGGSPAPTYTPPPAGPKVDVTKPGPTPVPDAVDELADGAAPDAVK
ncbi:hypothetical protein [Aeromicrobium alkaliterrae]|uniref:DUF3618 domain-containing protein n=1 Tax=Aeromicrobium alkaliterrae TaxID=302168 RepID=A0ABN2JED3_9ACTN